MTTENREPCDADDLVCQVEKLHRLEVLGEVVAGEEFLEKYPQLEGIRKPLSEDLEEQKKVLQKGIDECAREESVERVIPAGVITTEEPPPEPEPEPVPATEVEGGD